MKNIFKVVKKELDKIFKFPRQIFTTLILPGLILFLIYALIGTGLDATVDKTEEVNSIIHVINSPESFEFAYGIADKNKVDLTKRDTSELENLKQAVLNGEINALIVFDEDFDQLIEQGNLPIEELPNVAIMFDSTLVDSYVTMERAQSLITLQQEMIYQQKGINPHIFNIIPDNIEGEEKSAAMMIAMLLPMVLMSFIFASALASGSDAIAGEKERGTIAKLLMLPIKRSEIIIGKIISTATVTILSAISSFIGLIASLPFTKTMFGTTGNISYSALEIIGLVVILLLIALLASTILLIFSTLAKNIKEASAMSMPVYIAAVLIPVFGMFSTADTTSKVLYVLPIYNTVLGLQELLSFNFDLINFLLILGSSLVYIFIFILILVRLFKSERVLYAK